MKIRPLLLIALCGAALFAVWTTLTSEGARDAPAGREAPAPDEGPGDTRTVLTRAAPGSSERETIEQQTEAEEEPTEQRPEALPRPESTQPQGWILMGRLTSVSGALHGSLAGSVELVDQDGRVSKTTVEQGKYRIEGLAPGRWYVTPRSEGWRGQTREVVLPLRPATLELDLVLDPVPEIRVEAYALDGTPLLDALDKIEVLFFERPRPVATLDPCVGGIVDYEREIGVFRPADGFGQAHLGNIELPTPRSVFVHLVLFELVVATLEVPAGESSVVFMIDPARFATYLTTVRFTVQEARTGQPPNGCRVHLGKGPADLFFTLPPESEGYVELPDWPIGALELRLACWSSGVYEGVHQLEARAVNDLGTLFLEPVHELAGRVVLPPGLVGNTPPLTEIHLQNDRMPDGSPREPVFGLLTTCAPDGSFTIRLGPGRHRIWASLQWNEEEKLRSRQYYFDTEHDRLDDVTIELQRQPELIARPDASVPEGTWIVVRDGSGYRWERRQLQGRKPVRMRLPPGSYRMTLEDARGKLLGELPFELEWPGVDLELGL